MAEVTVTKYFVDRKDWRAWLRVNFDKKDEIWLEYPKKASKKPRIEYNTAVEEALCFGWIDSTIKSIDENTTAQRFTKRREKSKFSQANKERLKRLLENNKLHPSIKKQVMEVLDKKFVFPNDILMQLKEDQKVWSYYQKFSESYKRIRIAYIDSARNRPDEFAKRLKNFISKTKQNMIIKGFGGIDKYY